MLVRHEDRGDRFGRHAARDDAPLDLACREAGVDEDTRAAGFDDADVPAGSRREDGDAHPQRLAK